MPVVSNVLKSLFLVADITDIVVLRFWTLNLLWLVYFYVLYTSVIFVNENENENDEKRENNEFVHEN